MALTPSENPRSSEPRSYRDLLKDTFGPAAEHWQPALTLFLSLIGSSIDDQADDRFEEGFATRLPDVRTMLPLAGYPRPDLAIQVLRQLLGAHLLASARKWPDDFAARLQLAIRMMCVPPSTLKRHSPSEKWYLRTAYPRAGSLGVVRELERILGLPGFLSATLPFAKIPQVEVLEPDGMPAGFGACLRTLRTRTPLSDRELGTRVASHLNVRALRSRFHRWQNGKSQPRPVDRDFVRDLDQVLAASGALFARYETVLRKTIGNSSRSLMGRGYSVWNAALQAEFDQLVQFKSAAALPGHIRRHKNGRWRKASTIHTAQKNLGLFLGYCRLPPDAEDPLLRGEGLKEGDLSIALVADADLFIRYIEFKKRRSYGGKICKGNVAHLAMFYVLVTRERGYFWQFGSRFCSKPALLGRCPIEAYDPSTEEMVALESPRERFRALCEDAHDRYGQLMREWTCDTTVSFSRDPCRRIQGILSGHERPFAVLIKLCMRLRIGTPPAAQMHYWRHHVTMSAIIHLVTLEPLRAGTIRELKASDLFRTDDGKWHARVPPERFKNERFGARDGWVGPVHEWAHEALTLYFDQVRPHLVTPAGADCFFITKRGQLTKNGFSVRMVDITRRFLGDEAPEGLNPHAFRHLVATDAIRKDLLQGFAIAAQLLKNTVKTVERSYGHLRADDRTKFINSTIDAKLSEAMAALGAEKSTRYLTA